MKWCGPWMIGYCVDDPSLRMWMRWYFGLDRLHIKTGPRLPALKLRPPSRPEIALRPF